MEPAMLRAGRIMLSSLLVFVTATAPIVAQAEVDCFERNDSQRLAFDVFQLSSPPPHSDNKRDYADRGPMYPATDFATAQNRHLRSRSPVSATGFKYRKHYFLWANRCLYLNGVTPDHNACRNPKLTKGNLYPGMPLVGPMNDQLRTVYSTYKKANDCTLLSVRGILGEKWEAISADALSAGLVATPATADRGKLASMARVVPVGVPAEQMTLLVDVCVIDPEAASDDTAGIVLDYEVFDNRTPTEALAFFRELQALVRQHGKTLIVNTNPLPRDANGINATNAREILNIVDGFAPTITSGATLGNPDTRLTKHSRKLSPIDSYRLQLDVLTDNGRAPLSLAMRQKILWSISLFDLELPEAKQLHDEIVAQKYRGIMLWRNYVKQGGACSRGNNQVTACLALGECGGSFGATR
jgi:hypothetical protein